MQYLLLIHLDEAATAETPHGSADFCCEVEFEDALGREVALEGCFEIGVDIEFVEADEVGGGEEAVLEGVFRGGGFACGCLGSAGGCESWRC